MNKHSRQYAISFTIISALYALVPEALFAAVTEVIPKESKHLPLFIIKNREGINALISRLLLAAVVLGVVFLTFYLFQIFRNHVTISGTNYCISVEYGDILKTVNCRRIIAFDECFTTEIGNKPYQIKASSLCGQYLIQHPNLNIEELIRNQKIKPAQSKSRYNKTTRYESGTLISNGDDLLLSFVKLDENGRGYFTREEYIDCLSLLWKEIEIYCGDTDVCIPILGSGLTRFESASGASYSQRELLEIIINSYKLSSHKIKKPHKLRIICRKTADFSLKDL